MADENTPTEPAQQARLEAIATHDSAPGILRIPGALSTVDPEGLEPPTLSV